MGRSTTIIHMGLYQEFADEFDSDEYQEIKLSEEFVTQLEKKYDIEFKWSIHKEVVSFDSKDLCGEPDDHIRALLEIAKQYNLSISGSFTYQDDKSGGRDQGLVYIAKDFTAVVYEFDNDICINTLAELRDPPFERRVIRLECN